ncbi:cytochrome b561 domain-containing protein At2g30890-like [Mangifera indica]|uniref:cytochrome b561 domain-containing protein At2g30890-like n=1 Tax=Mangifera indica TaxID=29780 RepID=UPI001CF9BE04|nr:cytochrome b561 domain-containing protein At2g30890-like [Mangifera indica]
MQVLQKLVSFGTILVLPSLSSSLEQANTTANGTIDNGIINQLSPKLLFEITVHGFLLWASMGLLIPVGILIIRMSNRIESGRRHRIIFYAHAISQAILLCIQLQTLAVLVATAGAVLSFRNFNNSFSNHHQKLGVALYGIIWLQALMGFFRPQRGSKGRSLWFLAHWLVGTVVSLLGIINMYTGLQAFHEKTSRSVRLWTIMFTTQISLIAFFYFFQDKWAYIQKQGVILGNELSRPTDKRAFNQRQVERIDHET